MRNIVLTSIFIGLLLSFAASAQPHRRKIAPAPPKKAVVIVPTASDVQVSNEVISLVKFEGLSIVKVIAVDSSKIQIIPFSGSSFGLLARQSFQHVKELLVIGRDTTVRLKVAFREKVQAPLDFAFVIVPAKKIPKPVPILPAQLDSNLCQTIRSNVKTNIKVSKSEHEMDFYLQSVRYDQDQLYFKFWVFNESALPFTIDRIIVSVLSQPKKGNATSLSLPTKECACNNPVVAFNKGRHIIMSAPYTALRKDEVFEFRLFENTKISRGRDVSIQLKSSILNKTAMPL